MNVSQIANKVKKLIGNKAEAEHYEVEVREAIADSVKKVWTMRKWTFVERLAHIDTLPDINGETLNITGNFNNDSREITFEDEVIALYEDAQRTATYARSWVGQTFWYDGRDYTIATIGENGMGLILTEPLRLTSGLDTESNTAWKIKFTTIRLPQDCSEVLGILDTNPSSETPDRNRLHAIPFRDYETYGMNRNLEGNPTCYVNMPDTIIPAAGSITVQNVDDTSPTASDNFGFITTKYVELAWAFMVGGIIGPISASAVAKISGNSKAARILVSMFADDGVTPAATDAPDYTNRPYAMPFEGYQKVLLFNSNIYPSTGIRKGPPAWRLVNNRMLLSTERQGDSRPMVIEDDTSSAYINHPHQLMPFGNRMHDEPDGVVQTIRLWPRPNVVDKTFPRTAIVEDTRTAPEYPFHRMQLRYIGRPKDVAEDSDVPEIPAEFQNAIAYDAAASMLYQLGDPVSAKMMEDRFEKIVSGMKNRYLVQQNDMSVRKGWGIDPGANGVSPLVWGFVTKALS